MATLLIVLSNLIVIGLVYFMWRNEAVYRMRQRANNACYKYEMYCLESEDWEQFKLSCKIADEIRNRNDYDKMFFSFRPIEIEKWYTPSECEIIEKFSTDD